MGTCSQQPRTSVYAGVDERGHGARRRACCSCTGSGSESWGLDPRWLSRPPTSLKRAEPFPSRRKQRRGPAAALDFSLISQKMCRPHCSWGMRHYTAESSHPRVCPALKARQRQGQRTCPLVEKGRPSFAFCKITVFKWGRDSKRRVLELACSFGN